MAFLSSANTVIDNDRIVKVTSGASGSRPGSPSTGMTFFNTTSGKLEVWNGSAWKEAITSGGEIPPLWGWGRNNVGQIGNNSTTNALSPVSVVGGFTDWENISSGFGNYHGLAIRANGTAWAWGSNSGGRLGDGTTTNRSSPVSVVGGFTWRQLSAGAEHSAAIRTNGTAWCWGKATFGQLGDNVSSGFSASQISPVSVVGGFTDWIQISAGSGHTAAVRASGTAWCWGYRTSGRLGNDVGTAGCVLSPVSVVGGFTDWTQITAGGMHTAAIRANGTAWAWGVNYNGRLGDGTTTNRSSPVSVVGGFTDWINISANKNTSDLYGHTAAIRANGTAWAWGTNYNGQLGDGTTTHRSSPVSVVGGFTDWTQISAGPAMTGAIRTNGTAWVWGAATDAGGMGDGTASARSSPVSVIGGFTDWVEISIGGLNSPNPTICALRSQPVIKR